MKAQIFGPMGTIHRLVVASEILTGTVLGDPIARVAVVYVPAGHDGPGCHCWSTWSA